MRTALGIVVWWQVEILHIVKREGSGLTHTPEKVLPALVTTTTVNVFGFLVIVMKFVFPPPKGPPDGHEGRPRSPGK